jgi:hypothetical protein
MPGSGGRRQGRGATRGRATTGAGLGEEHVGAGRRRRRRRRRQERVGAGRRARCESGWIGTDGGEKLWDTVAAKFNLEDEII